MEVPDPRPADDATNEWTHTYGRARDREPATGQPRRGLGIGMSGAWDLLLMALGAAALSVLALVSGNVWLAALGGIVLVLLFLAVISTAFF